jgi:hypothetical protein
MTRARAAGVAATLLLAAVLVGPQGIPAHATPTVELDRDVVTTRLGQKFRFTSTIRTDGAGRTTATIAHLDVLGLDPDVYVDPEDWSGERTQFLGPLPAGSSTPVTWTVQAVNSGRFLLYVTLTEPDAGGTIVASPALRLDVGAQPKLAGQGALPLAIGVPGALLALVVATARRRRTLSRPVPVD